MIACVNYNNEMSAFNTKDLNTEINTIMLSESDKLMDNSNTFGKNILEVQNSSQRDNSKKLQEDNMTQSSHTDLIQRPHTIENFVEIEKLREDPNVETTFTHNNCNEDEEFWIVDIPKSINPLHLKGHTLQLGSKSSIKIGEDKYCATNRECKSSLTCVFGIENKNDSYKTVNIRPSGSVSLRKKLSGISRNKVPYEKSETVPFPKNIKLRHPLFGVQLIDKQ